MSCDDIRKGVFVPCDDLRKGVFVLCDDIIKGVLMVMSEKSACHNIRQRVWVTMSGRGCMCNGVCKRMLVTIFTKQNRKLNKM